MTDAAQTHPRTAKKRLAREIIALYHGPDAAQAADDEFERLHGKAKSADAVPDDMPEVPVPAEIVQDGTARLTDLVKAAGLAASSGEAKRLIQQGGVSLDGKKIDRRGGDGPGRTRPRF